MKLYKQAKRFGRTIVDRINVVIVGGLSALGCGSAFAQATGDNPFVSVNVSEKAEQVATGMSTDLSILIGIGLFITVVFALFMAARMMLKKR